MVKNVTGGNKHKKAKNSAVESKKRPITYADNQDTFYALVKAPLGGGHMMVHCNDGIDRIGTIRGGLYKSNYIVPGDMTLVSLREFEKVKIGAKERCDIMLKYNPEEVLQLVKRGMYYKDSQRAFMTKLDKSKANKAGGIEEGNDSGGDDSGGGDSGGGGNEDSGGGGGDSNSAEGLIDDDDNLYMLKSTVQDYPLVEDNKEEEAEWIYKIC